LVEVDAGALVITTHNPAGLAPFESAVGIQLVLEHPFTSEDSGAWWPWNETPSAIAHKSIKLVLHSPVPIVVAECSPN
jgi:hypothetical protein